MGDFNITVSVIFRSKAPKMINEPILDNIINKLIYRTYCIKCTFSNIRDIYGK